jgi:biopolymer transport protein ExbB
MLSSAILNRHHPKEIMKESIEEATTHILPDLQRFLTTLGTIASITPLLGLLGTVLGMIQVFSAMLDAGVGNPRELAGGISTALITTAAGLAVAIPSLMFYRYFRGKVENLLIVMQQEALKLIEVMHGDREYNDDDENA